LNLIIIPVKQIDGLLTGWAFPLGALISVAQGLRVLVLKNLGDALTNNNISFLVVSGGRIIVR